jgi:hypothetical protein
MPVVINELELVAEPPPVPTPVATATRPAGMTPLDVADVVRHLEDRRARVRAD